jgi:DNA-binding transcriptional LysR family regulator
MQSLRKPISPVAPRLRWDDARILISLLRTRSLLAAGKELGLNASTVSRRLDALERTLGGRLFDRSPEGALPTALAEEMAPHAELMERAATALAMTAEGREVVPEGEVRITAPPGYAEYLVAPAIPRLLGRYPGLRVTLDANAQVADLTRREADIAVRSARPTIGELVATKLGTIRRAFLASPKYAAKLAPLRSLQAARWITWGPDFGNVAPARFIAEHVPESSIALRTSHMGTQVAAAEAGVGIIFATETLPAYGSSRRCRFQPSCERWCPRARASSGWWGTAYCAMSRASPRPGSSCWRRRGVAGEKDPLSATGRVGPFRDRSEHAGTRDPQGRAMARPLGTP